MKIESNTQPPPPPPTFLVQPSIRAVVGLISYPDFRVFYAGRPGTILFLALIT